MKNNLRVLNSLVVLAMTLVSLSVSAAPPIYMNYGDIKGDVTATGFEKWMDIESWSFGASQPTSSGNTILGNRIGTDASCSTGRLNFRVKGTPLPAMTKECQSRNVRPNLVVVKVGAGGKEEEHHLQNVSFVGCQTGPADHFTVSFSKCTTHAATTTEGKGGSIVVMDPTNAAPQPNAVLIGLGPRPIPVAVESLTIKGNTATLKTYDHTIGGGSFVLPTNQTLPSLKLQITNGPTWEFIQYKLTDILVSSATGGKRSGSRRPTQSISINFTKVSGPASGFNETRR